MKHSSLSLLLASMVTLFGATSPASAAGGVGTKMIAYAKAHLGSRVPATSAGECTDLVVASLAASNGQPGNFSNSPFYTWGRLVKPVSKESSTGKKLAPKLYPEAGYIIQFENCHFATANSSNDFPKHTAIIEHVSGSVLTLLHQNVNGNRTVVRSTLDMSTLKSGTFQYFSPLPKA